MTSSLAKPLEATPPAPGSAAWLDALRTELAAAWEESGRGKFESCQVVGEIERPYSRIHFLEVQSPSGRVPVVAKSTIRDPMNRPAWDRQVQAKVEFEILEHLRSRFETLPGLGVPRPICVLPELDTFVMERISGIALADEHAALRRLAPQPAFEILGSHYERLGMWLARFQEFTKPGSGDQSSLGGIAERVRLRLDRIAGAASSRVPRDFTRHVEERLVKLLSQATDDVVPIAGRHGDFGPWNVMISTSGAAPSATSELHVLDFMGYAREPRPLDALNVLYFLTHEARNLLTSPVRSRDLQRRFLRGLNSQLKYSRPLLLLCELHARVYGVWDCLSTPALRMHHRWQQRKALKQDIAWLLADAAPGLWQLFLTT